MAIIDESKIFDGVVSAVWPGARGLVDRNSDLLWGHLEYRVMFSNRVEFRGFEKSEVLHQARAYYASVIRLTGIAP